jgi:hypothetical protein
MRLVKPIFRPSFLSPRATYRLSRRAVTRNYHQMLGPWPGGEWCDLTARPNRCEDFIGNGMNIGTGCGFS